MANLRQFDLDDLSIRPGTYFNPQTEVMIVVDDSPVDTVAFNMEDLDGADWVLIDDDVPIDEHLRDDLMQRFQVRHGSALSAGLGAGDDIVDDDENAEPEADEVEEL
jgi:hypothetical protein